MFTLAFFAFDSSALAAAPIATANCRDGDSAKDVFQCLSSMREAFGKQPYLKTYRVRTCAEYQAAYLTALEISDKPQRPVSCQIIGEAVRMLMGEEPAWLSCAVPLLSHVEMGKCLASYVPSVPSAPESLEGIVTCARTRELMVLGQQEAGIKEPITASCTDLAAAVGVASRGQRPAWAKCLRYSPEFANRQAPGCLSGEAVFSCDEARAAYRKRLIDVGGGALPVDYSDPDCSVFASIIVERPKAVPTTPIKPFAIPQGSSSKIGYPSSSMPDRSWSFSSFWNSVSASPVILVAIIAAGWLISSWYYGRAHKHKLERTDTPLQAEDTIRKMAREKRGEFSYSGEAKGILPVRVTDGNRIKKITFTFRIVRNLAAMTHREREFTRIFLLMRLRGWLQPDADNRIHFGLVWGNGKASVAEYKYRFSQEIMSQYGINTIGDAIGWYARQIGVNAESAISELLNVFGQMQANMPDDPLVKEIAASIESGNHLFSESDIPGSVFEPTKERLPLLLGILPGPGRTELSYSGEGSLATIAPPGAGKTQCHIIPNLLRWPGPAVVLDIKGELWEKTSAFRNTLGPVYRFAPFDPDHSHRYNPLTSVRSRPDLLWEDSEALAELMVVPQAAKDPFWEQSAQRTLAGFIAYVCRKSVGPESRSMSEILDLTNGLDVADYFARASIEHEVRQLRREAKSLEEMQESVRGGVLSQLQTGLKAWAGGRVEKATERSDWSPGNLRAENATLYICVKPNEIEPALSVLRVLIGQHLRLLTDTLHERGSVQDVLFFVDEFPQLRQMPPIEEGISVGRSYGVRLWLIAQSLAQVRANYPNRGDGMLGSCGIQAYMNPPLQDGTAQKVADEIGFFESVIDGHKQRIAEPQALAGPEFKDDIIVIAHGTKPVRLKKLRAFEDDVCKERSGMAKWPPDNDTTPRRTSS